MASKPVLQCFNTTCYLQKYNDYLNLKKQQKMTHTLKLSTNVFRSVKNSSIAYFFGSNAKYLAVFWNIVVIFLYMPSSTSTWSFAVFKNSCSAVKESILKCQVHWHSITSKIEPGLCILPQLLSTVEDSSQCLILWQNFCSAVSTVSAMRFQNMAIKWH